MSVPFYVDPLTIDCVQFSVGGTVGNNNQPFKPITDFNDYFVLISFNGIYFGNVNQVLLRPDLLFEMRFQNNNGFFENTYIKRGYNGSGVVTTFNSRGYYKMDGSNYYSGQVLNSIRIYGPFQGYQPTATLSSGDTSMTLIVTVVYGLLKKKYKPKIDVLLNKKRFSSLFR